ncbi:hypothetical protein LCGC14_2561820 [marine sediment metagenome]|uniref:Type II secretion system protein GspF domain-containing protein n=1 Tax=marine sediment metagenome TaxID=412755 RepID=A0A0F9B7Q5_9ZZZZ
MKLSKIHISAIVFALIIMGGSFFLKESNASFFIIGIGIIIAASPFVFSLIRETKLKVEQEEMFVEFTRNLVESVKTGIPVSRSIINVKDKPYGSLSRNINKLANQIYIGIPLAIALQTFSKDVKNKTISRAITLIGEAEKSGGDIGGILESVADAVSTSDKLKKERKAVISALVIQGYIIFFIFILIILILQFRLIPMILGIGQIGALTSAQITTEPGITQVDISNAFLYLLLVQGFFSGLTIGKLAEKSLKAGIKHSFILTITAFLFSSGANLFFGG